MEEKEDLQISGRCMKYKQTQIRRKWIWRALAGRSVEWVRNGSGVPMCQVNYLSTSLCISVYVSFECT